MSDTSAIPLNEEIRHVAEEAMRLVLEHVEAGRFDEAETLCRAVLDMAPGHAEAQYQLGLLARRAGLITEAATYLLGALQADASQEGTWLTYIDVLLDAGELSAAGETIALGKRHGLRGGALDALVQRLARAERGAPSPKEIGTLRALIEHRRLDEAERMAHVFIADCPRHAFGWKALGMLCYMRGQLARAIEATTRATECDPTDADAFSNLGLLLKEALRHEDAVVCLRRALDLNPKHADAHNNLAVTLLTLNRFSQAEASARAAVAINPKIAQAWNTIGVALMSQSRIVGAVEHYRRALKIEPDNADVLSNLLFSLSQMEGIDTQALFAEHLRYGKRIEAPLRKEWRPHANERDPQRRLRIGFLSGDLRDHAVASFIEPIFERLAGCPGVSLHAYHNYLVTDHVSRRLQGYMAQWRDVVGMDDDTLAQRIRDDGIDILVDLSGHTAHNRLPVVARKPAPVQVTWMGYPGTTGLQAVDYYLTDRAIVPPGRFDDQFTEKVVRLPVPAPFQPELGAAPVNPLPALANGYMTFGSFNRVSKIGRAVVSAWSRLLRALPDSRLLLGGVPENGADQLVGWLAEEGIAADRIAVHPRTNLHDYLALHNQVDLLLDSFPYSGGTTTVHALWMGVPTLTVEGDRVAGRQTVCYLEHTGLPQYICQDADDFERKGLAISADLETLAQVRATLRDRFALPSSDGMSRTADVVEQAFRTMWRRWCDGSPAAAFEIEE
jgi:predicted O-linked N-acetylglucosamine transferase (SPINDLY family)